jgi:hypothetical protein
VFFIAFAVLAVLAYFLGTRQSAWRRRFLARHGYKAAGECAYTFPELVTKYSIGAMPGKQNAHSGFVRLDFIFAGIAFLAAFIVYLLTVAPELCTGDSGELTTAMYNLGAAHPPGTPLYTMIGKVFTYLPIGSIAYRINFMAAFFGALTVAFLFLFMFRLLHRGQDAAYAMRDRYIALAASLIFAFSLTMWAQAIVAEKYTLNSFFAPLLFLAVLVWQESVFSSLRAGRPSYADKYILLTALLMGLALTNHLLLLGYIPPLFLFFFVVTQVMSEPHAQAAAVSQKTARVLVLALVTLVCLLFMDVFSESATLFTRILFVLFTLGCLGSGAYMLLLWLKSMRAASGLPQNVQYACGACIAAAFILCAVIVLVNAWSVPLLDNSNAARTIIGIFIPLITLGLVAIYLLRRLPDAASPREDDKMRKRILLCGLGIWTFLLLLVVFEQGVMALLKIVFFFLPSAWFSDTAIRSGLDFIGVSWGFDALAFLTYILGVTIAVFAYIRARKKVQEREQFTETSAILFKCALFFLFPMLLYMTLVIRANAIAKIPDPPLSWGETVDSSRVINHFLRKQYPKASMYFYNRIPEIADGWVKMHVEQYLPISTSRGQPWTAGEVLISLPIFLCIVALGMWALWRRNKLWFWLLLACFLTFNILLVTMLSPKDTPRDWYFNGVFFVPSHLIIAVYIAFALQWAVNLAAGRLGKLRREPRRETLSAPEDAAAAGQEAAAPSEEGDTQ